VDAKSLNNVCCQLLTDVLCTKWQIRQKPGLSASYTIWHVNEAGLSYRSRHTCINFLLYLTYIVAVAESVRHNDSHSADTISAHDFDGANREVGCRCRCRRLWHAYQCIHTRVVHTPSKQLQYVSRCAGFDNSILFHIINFVLHIYITVFCSFVFWLSWLQHSWANYTHC